MKIGFACKYLHPDQTQKKKLLEDINQLNSVKNFTIKENKESAIKAFQKEKKLLVEQFNKSLESEVSELSFRRSFSS